MYCQGTMQNLRMQNFVTKYVIFCELWEKMSVPDIKNLGLQVSLEDYFYCISSNYSWSVDLAEMLRVCLFISSLVSSILFEEICTFTMLSLFYGAKIVTKRIFSRSGITVFVGNFQMSNAVCSCKQYKHSIGWFMYVYIIIPCECLFVNVNHILIPSNGSFISQYAKEQNKFLNIGRL